LDTDITFLSSENEYFRKESKMIKKALLIVILILAGFVLISCQTVSGLGRDIQWLGDKTAEVLER
jgi:predicted small secreted protein